MCGMNLAFDRDLIGPAMYFGLMGDGRLLDVTMICGLVGVARFIKNEQGDAISRCDPLPLFSSRLLLAF
ncbi:hypothetical protein RND71_014532 [Anisodus tanguticus]|uniref:Uncharacterized protein n=1 Tax=Anisodus tanguticus TaxID=243964 RepID=A0AAE1VF46_9SOLA|nr:hypothetical protein RND71_014532 [Anisodus tanguticus]